MNQTKQWFLCSDKEIVGPFLTEVVQLLLDQADIQLTDFAWCEEMNDWKRLCDIEEFSGKCASRPTHLPPGKTQSAEFVPLSPVDKNHATIVRVRKFQRVPINGFVEIGEYDPFELVDISEGGVFIRADEPLSVGTQLEFILHSKAFGVPLLLQGVVARHLNTSDGNLGFAVEFSDLSALHKGALNSYVKKMRGN